jgi:hypothetical protein
VGLWCADTGRQARLAKACMVTSCAPNLLATALLNTCLCMPACEFLVTQLNKVYMHGC